jgi:hypothetical protein
MVPNVVIDDFWCARGEELDGEVPLRHLAAAIIL